MRFQAEMLSLYQKAHQRVLARPSLITFKHPAIDKEGYRTDPLSLSAVAWSPWDFLFLLARIDMSKGLNIGLFMNQLRTYTNMVHSIDVIEWQYMPGRTIEDILELFTLMIQLLSVREKTTDDIGEYERG